MPRSNHEVALGAGVMAIGALLAFGALSIPASAGYGGVGPNFLPWVVSVALLVCGAILLWQAFTGGYQHREAPSGAERADWAAMAWVSAGVLVAAALITSTGFVLACALCFTLAVRGLRGAEGRPAGNARQTASTCWWACASPCRCSGSSPACSASRCRASPAPLALRSA